MKNRVNITIKDYDERENICEIKEINIKNKLEIRHLEDNKIGIIDGIRNDSISILWTDNSRENFYFNQLDKLVYTNPNEQKLFKRQLIDCKQYTPKNQNIINNINEECTTINPIVKSDIDVISPEAEALIILKNFKEAKGSKDIDLNNLKKVSDTIAGLDWTTLSKQF